MDRTIRNVIARYQEDPTVERPELFNEDWMSYLKEKARGYPKSPRAVIEMLEDLKRGDNPEKRTEMGKAFDTYNPYDYVDPTTKPKDMKDGPPFYNLFPYAPDFDYGVFNKPRLLEGPGGALHEWYKARRRDWTADPDEQAPAISLDRKISSVMEKFADDTSGFRVKTAASMREIINNDFHYKNPQKQQRAAACRVTWENQSNKEQVDKGLLIFQVTSPSEGDEPSTPRTVYMQFLRSDQPGQTIPYANLPVQLSCSCESFLFYGAQYYALRGNYLYLPGRRINTYIAVPPKHQKQYTIHRSPHYPEGRRYPGRGLNFRVCKHILAVYMKVIRSLRPIRDTEDYPITSPPSKIMNPEVWEKLMKFPFDEDEIKERLRQGKAPPAFFRRETITPAVVEWFNTSWIPLDDSEKIKVLSRMIESPERIFFILTKEAYLQKQRGRRISEHLIDEGYKFMERGVGKPTEKEPEQVYTKTPGVPEDQVQTGNGTWVSEPGGDINAEDYMTEASPDEVEDMDPDSGEPTGPTAPTAPTEVEPAVKPAEEPPLKHKQREIAKKLRPGLKRASARNVISKFLSRQQTHG